MKLKKAFRWLLSLLCLALGALVALGILDLCREGLALRARDSFTWMFNRQQVGARLLPLWPLLLLILLLSLAGRVWGIRIQEGGGKVPGEKPVPAPRGKTRVWQGLLLVLALLLLLHGAWNGGARDVLKKAVNICTECIGLG